MKLGQQSSSVTLSVLEQQSLIELTRTSRHVDVESRARELIRQYPNSGFVWTVLALSLQAQRKDALPELRRAAELLPEDAATNYRLGNVLRKLGQLEDAAESYRKTLRLKPDHIDGKFGLARALKNLGRLEEAAEYFRQVLEIKPDWAVAHYNLGNTLRALGQIADCLLAYRRAVELNPAFADAHGNLGLALKDAGQFEAATASFRLALEINPDNAAMHSNLGATLLQMKQLDAAVTSFNRALEIIPDHAEVHNNLGLTTQHLGQIDMAIAHHRRALEIRPEFATARSNLLVCLLGDERLTQAEVFNEHKAFGKQFEAAHKTRAQRHSNSCEPLRRLRLGFVSADLRDHPVASFIEPIWAALDTTQVELWIYSNHTREDSVTMRLRALTHQWRNVAGYSDTDLALRIRADEIDVLIDLSGHMAGNRLLVFAQKPAPIQVTWIGYPNTTGLEAIDYVVADRFNAPQGLYEHFYTEKFARLPSSGTFLPAAVSPPVNALPLLSRNHVTFGSFNRVSKLGNQVVAAWSRVLRAVPDSRLLLGNVGEPLLVEQLTERFRQHGIAAARLSFKPRLGLRDYLALHHEVDIILDTWPYTGGTTTNHAVWMGVPVVTLQGPSRVHCQSAAVLGRMNLQDWVAHDVDDFVRIAAQWSAAPQALAALRAGMRERWQSSPLRQPATVARGLDLALRWMWQRWCAGLAPEDFEISEAAVFASKELK